MLKLVPPAPLPGSALAGLVPPTQSVTSLSVPAAPVVAARYVITPSRPAMLPLRCDASVLLTTRTK